VFDDKSRYAKEPTYQVPDRYGRDVAVVGARAPQMQTLLGIHVRRQGQRLDHIAAKYLRDATGFWRLCDMGDVMHPQTLAEAQEIPIPGGRR